MLIQNPSLTLNSQPSKEHIAWNGYAGIQHPNPQNPAIGNLQYLSSWAYHRFASDDVLRAFLPRLDML